MLNFSNFRVTQSKLCKNEIHANFMKYLLSSVGNKTQDLWLTILVQFLIFTITFYFCNLIPFLHLPITD